MYCPVCFADTLKPASSGVVKCTFNKKSKNTSQFYYNTGQDRPEDIYKKLRDVIADYFKWYATFQNKDVIKEFEAYSADFVCKKGCKLNVTHRMNVVDILLEKQAIISILQEEGEKYGIVVNLENLESA
jgi:hypothetical protein